MPVTFFCFAKRKSPKKRRPAVWVPTLRCGQPAVLEYGGVWHKLASLKQVPALIRLPLRSSAQPGRGNRERGQRHKDQSKLNKDSPWRVLVVLQVFGIGIRLFGIPSPPLLDAPRSAGPGGSGIALSERSEFSETPPEPSTAGCPKRSAGTQQVGSPFLLLTLLLAKQKKSELPPGNPRPATLRRGQTQSEQDPTRELSLSPQPQSPTTDAQQPDHRCGWSPSTRRPASGQ
jgi:hypothetical protein